MNYLGVIGYPLEQSLSPVFQQAALDHLRLNIEYESWPTPADGLATRLTGLRAPAVLGANVTIPHKEAVLPAMDQVDEIARRVGAVNTIINRDGQLHGHNTDVAGFLRGLREDAGFDPSGRRALIAGAGGSARAVAVALIEAKAAAVSIINRTPSRAARLVEDMESISGETALSAAADDRASWAASLERCDVLINCTSVGSAGNPGNIESPMALDLLHPNLLVYDLIYRPSETPLMRAARGAGASVVGGLPMLIYQGAASFEIWTGRAAPLDIMFDAAHKALQLTTVSEER